MGNSYAIAQVSGRKKNRPNRFRRTADVSGSFVRTSRVKNFGQALETWKNKHLGADIHDPNAQSP